MMSLSLKNEFDPFANDGCTGFIDGWGGLDWRYCCDLHDKHFLEGQDWGAFLDANVRLFHCVATHDAFAAPLMFLAVMTVGVWFFWRGKHR